MAEYRRFVAYVYEYRKGMKGDNCGFVKVEVRERRCMVEVHLHCEGLSSGSECEVYGFIRTEGLLDGILLGRCQTERDQIVCALETDAEGIGETGISLEKLGGMIIRTRSGGFFGTEWDDLPIRPGNFREYREARILQSEASPDKGQELKMAEITQADTEELYAKEESPADGTEKECGRTDRRNPGREDDWPKPDDFRRKAGRPESDDPGKERNQVGLEPYREEMEAG
ncbi:MAG: hypothetical protein LUG62_12410, partial [Clostridiales bacterium]|nr:hypothetical protein [Clostridiales bacterium]